jgi:hypothetical protein
MSFPLRDRIKVDGYLPSHILYRQNGLFRFKRTRSEAAEVITKTPFLVKGNAGSILMNEERSLGENGAMGSQAKLGHPENKCLWY